MSLPPKLTPRVLVVDDHPELRAALCATLIAQGYLVSVAEDGERALEVLAEESFDAALVDVRMPRLDGFGLLEQMREQHIDCPVVLTSVVADAHARRRGKLLGVVAFHEKPFSVDALLTDLELATAGGQVPA